MKKVSKIISVYSADTAGASSALYELGGMVVVHDASGCNSTYSTHDEPRWYDIDSAVYISALTESDSIMGNDERFIADVCQTANEIKPKFIAIAGSPMPMMTGFDFDYASQEIELRTGIPTMAIKTNGTYSYIKGAGEAFEKLLRLYTKRSGEAKSDKLRVNILGATPLDFYINSSIKSIQSWLENAGFEINCTLAMGDDLEKISHAGDADCSLVISSTGLKAGEYLWQEFGIPYCVGCPIGEEFSKRLAVDLETSAIEKKIIQSYLSHSFDDGLPCCAVVGEGVFCSSLCCGLQLDMGKNCRVIYPLDRDKIQLTKSDITVFDEAECEGIFAGCNEVYADPMYKPICKESLKFHSLPHFAFSGRCYEKLIPDIINKNLNGVKL